jgi:chromosome segregation ATPase
MKTLLGVFTLVLVSALSPLLGNPPAQQYKSDISKDANDWEAVKQNAIKSLATSKRRTELQMLAIKTQQGLEDIDSTMKRVNDLRSSKNPNKDEAKLLLAKLRQYQSQLKQTEKELVDIGRSKSVKKKDVERKQQEIFEQIYDDQVDEAKDNYDAAKEQFKKALKIINEHVERQTQVAQKITS